MNHFEELEHKAWLLWHFFLNRLDKFSVKAKWDTPCPALPDGDVNNLLLAHVGGPEAASGDITLTYRDTSVPYSGPVRVGTYFPHPNGNVILGCVDFDDHDNDTSLLDPFDAAFETAAAAERAGLHPYLELSGSGQGVHLWVFFEEWERAEKVRGVLLYLIPSDLKLANGKCANPDRSTGVEVFPKNHRVGPRGVGAAVWLPFWHGAEENATQFFRFDDRGELEFYTPETFAFSELSVDLVNRATADQSAHAPQKTPAGPMKSEYEIWAKDAIEALDLEHPEIYGQFLTDRRSGPYLECRDPWAANGDQKPSASVQTGEDDTVRGRFYSFITHESMSVFDFLMQLEGNGINTFAEARRKVAELSGVPEPSSGKDRMLKSA